MPAMREWLAACREITAGYIPGGSKEATFTMGLVMEAWVRETLHAAGLPVPPLRWQSRRKLLDVGCGNGRLAMGLAYREFAGHYTGIDIIEPCIQFCQRTFNRFDLLNYAFLHLDVYSGHYWPKGKTSASAVTYPFEDEQFDLAVALSMFSHIGSPMAAQRNVDQVYRVLVPGGTFLSTWYIGQDLHGEEKSAFTDTQIAEFFNLAGFTMLFTPGAIVDWGQTTVVAYKPTKKAK